MPYDDRPLTFRTSFDQVARDYDAVRPGYPAALIDELVTLAGLPLHGHILEIGCGTGQATIPFAQRGYHLTCVELGPALAAIAAHNCQAYPHVQIHVRAFEEWRGPAHAFDLVMAATAFHWIPPQIGYPKAAQFLKDTGALAIFSNEHPTPDAQFFADVQQIQQQLVPEWPDPTSGPPLEAQIEADIAATVATINATQLFAPVTVRTYPWTHTYTATAYVQLLNTYSNYRNLAAPTRRQVFAAITDLINTRYGGTITKPYLAVLYLAKKQPSRAGQ
jgi:SAM-dependent methyltransferase